jgi:hypothetical protein
MYSAEIYSFGNNDYFLESNNINDSIFNQKYHLNHNTNRITLRTQPQEVADFGKKISFNISKNYHFLNKQSIFVELPEITPIDGTYCKWTNGFMFCLFEKIELEVGGVIIDTLYTNSLDIIDELDNTVDKSQSNFNTNGKSDIIDTTVGGTNPRYFNFPLSFWFNKNISNSLPVCLIYKQDIKINCYLRNFEECVAYDGNTVPLKVNFKNFELISEYYYVDKNILKLFIEKSLTSEGIEFLIEKTNYIQYSSIPEDVISFNNNFTLNSVIKSIHWVFIEEDSISNNDYLNYSRRSDSKNPMKSCKLLLNGISYNDYLPSDYYYLTTNGYFFKKIPLKFINTICFSTNTAEISPTGAINGYKINDFILSFNMKENNPNLRLYIFAFCYEKICIKDGILYIKN